MQTQVIYRNVDGVRPTFRTYAESELAKLTRYHDHLTDAFVVLSQDGQHKQVEVTVRADGQRLSARNRGAHHGEALGRCLDTLRQNLIRHKGQQRGVDPAREVWH